MKSKQVDETGEAFIIGTGLSKTGTTSLVKTLRDWGVRSGHWTAGHNLFKLAEHEEHNENLTSSKYVTYLKSMLDKFEAV